MVEWGSQPELLLYAHRNCNPMHMCWFALCWSGLSGNSSIARPPIRTTYGWPACLTRAGRCPPTGCWTLRTRWSSGRSQRLPAWLRGDASSQEDEVRIWVGWILQHLNWKLSLNLLKWTQTRKKKKKKNTSVDSKIENAQTVNTNPAPA